MDKFNLVQTTIILGMVAAYIVLTSLLTYFLRSKTNAQFMTASRALPSAVVGVLLVSEFVGAKSTIGTTQSAFLHGAAAAWSVVGASIGFLLFGLFFVRRLYGTGQYTISGAISQKYGRSTTLMVSVIMIYALLLVNVGNYISGAAALESVMKVTMPEAMVLIALVSTFYYVFGGMKGVAYVTILHTSIKIIGIAILFVVAIAAAGGLKPMTSSMPHFYFTLTGKVGVPTIIAWIMGTTGAIFSTQFITQAISSARNANDARRSCFYAAALCFPIGIALALIGVAAKFLHPDIKSLYALPVFFGSMNTFTAGIVTVSIVASVFVSVSTVALGIVSLIMRDFVEPWLKPNSKKELQLTRLVALIIAIIPLFFVYFVPQILHLSFFTRALRLSISIVALIGFYLPLFRSTRGATIGLLVSAVATSLWYVLGDPYGINNMYIAAASPLLVMAIERGISRFKPSDMAVK